MLKILYLHRYLADSYLQEEHLHREKIINVNIGHMIFFMTGL